MNEYISPPWEQEINPDKPTIDPKGVKGLWIPREILQNDKLTYHERILLAYIYHLDSSPNHCYASNRYLSELLNCSEKTIANVITSLKKKEVLETVSWDGKLRRLRVTLY